MDISNIPNEFYKEIIDKDGQKIIFDFKDLDKSKRNISDLLRMSMVN